MFIYEKHIEKDSKIQIHNFNEIIYKKCIIHERLTNESNRNKRIALIRLHNCSAFSRDIGSMASIY